MKARWIVAAVLVGAAGLGAFLALRSRPPKPVEVVSSRVRRAPIERRVQGVGHVEPVTQVRVSANISGDLLNLTVKEGETVRRGQLLAEIDRIRFIARVRQAEASARSAASNVTLEQAEAKQATANARRVQELHAQGLTTDSEQEQAEANAGMVQARLDGAQQRVHEARALLDEATEQLSKTRIAAPIDGTVIDLSKKVGERIRGSDLSEDVLLTLAPLQAMEVDVDVSEQETVLVQVGQRAEIEIDALGDNKISGRVVEIASSAVVRNKGTEMETTTYKVKVALDHIPPKLRSGMTASVSVVTEIHPDVLTVPIEAVTARVPSELKVRAGEEKKSLAEPEESKTLVDAARHREKSVKLVFVIENDHVEPRPVTTGISSQTDLEVLEGLKDGEMIVVGPYRAVSKGLLPGSPVKVIEHLEDKSTSPAAGPVAREAQ